MTRYVYDDDALNHVDPTLVQSGFDATLGVNVTSANVGLGRLIEERRYDSADDLDDGTPTGNIAGTTRYGYDDLGRQTSVVEYGAGDATITAVPTRVEKTVCDETTGQPSSIASPEGTVHYGYDPATGRKSDTWTDVSTPTNPAGFASSPTSSSATTATHDDYGPAGRLSTVTLTRRNGQSLTTPEVTGYAYDAAGGLKLTALPNGVEERITRDAAGRATDRVARFTPTSDWKTSGIAAGATEPTGASPPRLIFEEHRTLAGDGRVLTIEQRALHLKLLMPS